MIPAHFSYRDGSLSAKRVVAQSGRHSDFVTLGSRVGCTFCPEETLRTEKGTFFFDVFPDGFSVVGSDTVIGL